MTSSNLHFDDHCDICRGSYKDPRILPCLHSFCLHCIEKCANGDTCFTCPVCKECVVLPEGGLLSLRRNIQLSDQELRKGILRKLFSSPDPQCESCVEGSSCAIAYCTAEDCDGFLCDYCIEKHNRMKKNRYHKIIMLEEARKKNHEDIESELPTESKCLDHKMNIEFYCKKCYTPLCANCVAADHHMHQKISTDESIIKEVQLDAERLKKCKEERMSMEIIDESERKVNSLSNNVDNYNTELYSMSASTRERSTQISYTMKEIEPVHTCGRIDEQESEMGSLTELCGTNCCSLQ